MSNPPAAPVSPNWPIGRNVRCLSLLVLDRQGLNISLIVHTIFEDDSRSKIDSIGPVPYCRLSIAPTKRRAGRSEEKKSSL